MIPQSQSFSKVIKIDLFLRHYNSGLLEGKTGGRIRKSETNTKIAFHGEEQEFILMFYSAVEKKLKSTIILNHIKIGF